MAHRIRSVLAAVLLALCLSPHPTPPRVEPPLPRLPLSFVANDGQWDTPARFVARRDGLVARIETDAVVLQVENAGRGAAVRMRFEGSSPATTLAAETPRPASYSFFLGNDPNRWRSGVATYAAVRYRELYQGIDLRVYDRDGLLEYDVECAPGAALEDFVVDCAGTDSVAVDGAGNLVLATAAGPIRMRAPTSSQLDAAGNRTPIACSFRILGEHRFGFAAPTRRDDLALVVDPVVEYSTYIGGSSIEQTRDVAVDASGRAIIVGESRSNDFPVTTGSYDPTPNGADDVYVATLTPDGKALSWATFIGGSSRDDAFGVTSGPSGVITLTGLTTSNDYPTNTGAIDTTYNGSSDVFVTRLTGDGKRMMFSTYLGGSSQDWGNKLLVDSQGVTTVVGWTRSSNFPATSSAYDGTFNGGSDAFVAQISANGATLSYSTFVGGSADDQATDLVAAGTNGNVLVTGWTASANFPTTANVYDTTHNGGQDAFVLELAANSGSLSWSTLFGGTLDDRSNAIAVDRFGVVAIGGITRSTDLPVSTNAFDKTHNGVDDAWVARLVNKGRILMYSTYIGSTRVDEVTDIEVESDGVVTLGGRTTGYDFPTTAGSYDPSFNGAWDGFLVRVEPGGNKLRYSTYVGGSKNDNVMGIVLDEANVVTLTGSSESSDFPTLSTSFDPTHNGANDAIAMRLDLLPTGVLSYGTSSHGCYGALALDVTGVPKVGNGSFAITCTNGPTSRTGFLLLGTGGLAAPIPFLGVGLWVDITKFFGVYPAVSNSAGTAAFALPIPNVPQLAGGTLHTQFLWVGPNSPAPCPPLGLSASNALAITIQP